MLANKMVNAVIQTWAAQSAFVKGSIVLLCGEEQTRSMDVSIQWF
jgi:hypothetical protein